MGNFTIIGLLFMVIIFVCAKHWHDVKSYIKVFYTGPVLYTFLFCLLVNLLNIGDNAGQIKGAVTDIAISLCVVEYALRYHERMEKKVQILKFCTKLSSVHNHMIKNKILQKSQKNKLGIYGDDPLSSIAGRAVKTLEVLEYSYNKILKPETIDIIFSYENFVKYLVKIDEPKKIKERVEALNSLFSNIIKDCHLSDDELIKMKIWSKDDIAEIVVAIEKTNKIIIDTKKTALKNGIAKLTADIINT